MLQDRGETAPEFINVVLVVVYPCLGPLVDLLTGDLLPRYYGHGLLDRDRRLAHTGRRHLDGNVAAQ